MALSHELQTQLNGFNARYGIEFDLENMENNFRQINSLRSTWQTLITKKFTTYGRIEF